MFDKLTSTLDFHGKALVLRAERQRTIASNIANADTPGYTSKDFKFADALSQATGQRSAGSSPLAMPTLQMATGTANHMNRGGSPAGAGAKPELGYGTASMTSLDNNSVDMDRERANFADNTVRYEATLRFINGSMKTLTTAINGQ
jgi:flagellar basal-body rod protein FlgB